MRITLHQILGIVIIVGIVMGVVVPIIGYSVGGHTIIMPDIKDLVRVASILGFKGRVAEELEYKVRPGFTIEITVRGGGVSVDSWNKNYMKITIYEITWPPKIFRAVKSYNVNYDPESNTVTITLTGYNAEVHAPEGIGSLLLKIDGGGADIDVVGLDTLSMNVNGGAVDINIDHLRLSNITININGGTVDAELRYGIYEGESLVNLKVSGGIIDVDIEAPRDAKVRIDSSRVSGLGEVALDNMSIAGTYIEPGYEDAETKLHIMCRVSGGIFDIGIRR